MRIFLDGKINRTYVQSLCMAFFHGISFPESQDEDPDGMSLYASLSQLDSQIYASVRLCVNGSETEKSVNYLLNQDESEERSAKTAIGQAIYMACKEITGRDIPWGLLTGIRPSKICYELLNAFSEDETRQILKNRYLLSEQRASLVISVAKNESAIMSLTNDKKCSIYISIPFCPSRCNYCSFISYAGKKLFDLIPSYVSRICWDIKETTRLINELGLEISCIYIGGGTPTMLNEAQLEEVLATIANEIDISSLDEFTLEGGRPDTITPQKLEIAYKYGVNRISVNPQTLNDKVLGAIGRHHTVSEFFEAFDKVKNSKIRSINTDLIAGLDGDNFESFKNTVDKIIDLSPDNVTVHTFCVKKSARILNENGEIYNMSDDDAGASVEYAYKALTSNGYLPYYMYRQKNTVGNLENVGYARPEYFGLYNVFMMSDAHTVFGIGAGATTKLVKNGADKPEILRIFSPKYPYEYLRENKKTDVQIKEFFDRR